jgi:hypothetical protein
LTKKIGNDSVLPGLNLKKGVDTMDGAFNASNLRHVVLHLFENRSIKLTVKVISADTGLPRVWLDNIRYNNTMDMDKGQKLYEYLRGRRLAAGWTDLELADPKGKPVVVHGPRGSAGLEDTLTAKAVELSK